MRLVKGSLLFIVFFIVLAASVAAAPYFFKRYQQYKNFNTPAAKPPTAGELASSAKQKKPLAKNSSKKTDLNTAKLEKPAILGINTADVREDTSSVQFLNLFKPAIPFQETVPWGSGKKVEYDENGWPTNLNGEKAGTKFLNRLPEGTVEDGFFTVLYEGEGEIFYGNDARLVVHRPNKDIIEIRAGKDHILNASLFIKKTSPDNHIRNIRILPEGGVCKGLENIRVKAAEDCPKSEYLAFEENEDTLLFNPDYLDFMKDFQVVRFMNMSGMTRNPVEKWNDRNTLDKATWGGKYGSRGAPVEMMVALANQTKAHPWFSMPYKANNDYIQKFAEYVKANLDPELKAYIEYSNEVWNPIFIHHDYAIGKGLEAKLDESKSPAGYKWYSRRSVEVFKIWEETFGGHEQLVRVMGSWASNQNMSSQILSFEDAYKHTDAVAIGPYVSAHPKVLRKAKNVDDVFKAMMDKKSKWGMQSTINYINKQEKVANSFGVDLIAYEGGQHLVDWDTRRADDDPNPLLYAANRDPRMGVVYDELMREWNRAGGKLFVAFSAPRIYSWYGSWGIKEHIRQPRVEAPKYDSLLRYLNNRLYPEKAVADSSLGILPEEIAEIEIAYAKKPHQIWDMSRLRSIPSKLINNNPSDISAQWQTNWDSKHLYFSFAITDESLQKGDQILLTIEAPFKKEITTKTQNDKGNKGNKGKRQGKGKGKKERRRERKRERAGKKVEDEEATPMTKAKTFTFTPFDSLGTQTHLIETDTGYLLNVAIPWTEILNNENASVKSGDKIGLNIAVTDVDEDEKGSKELYWVESNTPLPKIILSNTPVSQ